MSAVRVIQIKNLSDTLKIWGARQYQPAEEYTVPQGELPYLITDTSLMEDIVTIAQVSDGDRIFYDKIEAWNYILGNHVIEVIPRSPKNQYSLRPLGMGHKHINSSTCNDDVELVKTGTNTYTYTSTVSAAIYDCLTQDHSQIRDGVIETSYDPLLGTGTIKTMYDSLTTGTATLCKPVNLDFPILPNYGDLIYLWGCYARAADYGEDDLMRLQVIDKTGVGVLLGLYTQQEFEAMGSIAILKEYEECWVDHITHLGVMQTPDGAPGAISAGMDLRIVYYPRDILKTNIRVWYDYILTTKDE